MAQIPGGLIAHFQIALHRLAETPVSALPINARAKNHFCRGKWESLKSVPVFDRKLVTAFQTLVKLTGRDALLHRFPSLVDPLLERTPSLAAILEISLEIAL